MGSEFGSSTSGEMGSGRTQRTVDITTTALLEDGSNDEEDGLGGRLVRARRQDAKQGRRAP